MTKNSTGDRFLEQAALCKRLGSIPAKYVNILKNFYAEYCRTSHVPIAQLQDLFITVLDLVKAQIAQPFVFEPFHQLIRTPFDYYQFGIDFILPLIDLEHSSVSGERPLAEITAALNAKDNVVFFANHQVEADPQAISILLRRTHPQLAEQMIFVAGERVVTDPLAVPFSMGRNLLCIYSKRYIDHPPEDKEKKQLHNKRTMQVMSDLLAEGGKAIYVAPSGGRDRANAEGLVEVAPFDPQSIEMFYLMAQKAAHPTHFYPMALKTYDILPPPHTIQIELGEERRAARSSIHLGIGPRIDMDACGDDVSNKRERRVARARHIHDLVAKEYEAFP